MLSFLHAHSAETQTEWTEARIWITFGRFANGKCLIRRRPNARGEIHLSLRWKCLARRVHRMTVGDMVRWAVTSDVGTAKPEPDSSILDYGKCII